MLARSLAKATRRVGAAGGALRSVTPHFTPPRARGFWGTSSQPKSPPELLNCWRDPQTGKLPSVIQQWNAVFMFWWNRMRYFRFMLFGAGVLGGGCMVWDAWQTRRPARVARTLRDAFENGYVPAEAERKGMATLVARPVLHKQLQRLLRPLEIDNYALVVGAHGTGKSTAVRKAAREAPSDGPNGVVYCSVRIVSKFSKQLCEVLGFARGTFNVTEAVRRKGMEETKRAEPDPSLEPQASWEALSGALTATAVDFRAKHGRPMTLVIDNIQDMLQAKPDFVTVLQKFAKAEADHGNLRVVFVSSDFAALTHMMAHSEGSRCKAMEVGEADISEAEAVKYITTKLGWAREDKNKVAQYIVERITGTRFSLLNSVGADQSTMEAAKAWEVMLHEETVEALAAHRVVAGHPLFSHMLDAPGQKLRRTDVTDTGITVDQRDALVKTNVLAAHVDGTYTCAARHVVESFKQLRVPQTAPASAAAASTTTASSPAWGSGRSTWSAPDPSCLS